MKRVVTALVAQAFLACGGCDGGGGHGYTSVLECGSAEQDPTFCCAPDDYQAVDPAAFHLAPGSLAGVRVALRGNARHYVSLSDMNPCDCVGDLCTCTSSLAVEARGCDGAMVTVPLGGAYGNQSVACTGSGCWPLTIGLGYAVCGRWAFVPFIQDASGPSGQRQDFWLEVESFCGD